MKKVFQPEYLTKCIAVIALNCEEPWNMAKDMEKWIAVLMDILEEHMKEVPLSQQDAMRTASIFHAF